MQTTAFRQSESSAHCKALSESSCDSPRLSLRRAPLDSGVRDREFIHPSPSVVNRVLRRCAVAGLESATAGENRLIPGVRGLQSVIAARAAGGHSDVND